MLIIHVSTVIKLKKNNINSNNPKPNTLAR